MSVFRYESAPDYGRSLHIEDVCLPRIARLFGTPTYCYSHAILVGRYEKLSEAIPRAEICYSIKANDNLAVIRTFAQLGSGADVVSGGELRRALAAGIPPAKLVFAGVGKTRDEIDQALACDIGQFNIESAAELDALNDAAQAQARCARVALRVNPDVDPETHEKISTGKRGDKFGIDFCDAVDLYGRATRLRWIEPVGVAVHIGSQLSRLAPFEVAYGRVIELVIELRSAGYSIDRIDLGGGLGIRYQDETPPAVQSYGALIEKVRSRLDVTVIIEPGRWLVAPAGILLTRVISTKNAAGRNYAIIDAAMNDLVRPSLYGAWHGVDPVREVAQDELKIETDLAGPICESGDVLARGRSLPHLKVGELLILRDAGAYGSVMSSSYNSRLLPAEVMVRGDTTALLRARQSYDELLGRDLVPAWLSESDDNTLGR